MMCLSRKILQRQNCGIRLLYLRLHLYDNLDLNCGYACEKENLIRYCSYVTSTDAANDIFLFENNPGRFDPLSLLPAIVVAVHISFAGG